MHSVPFFFGWPTGAIWGNVLAMPVCGVLAGAFAVVFRNKLGRALKRWHKRHFGHHAELDAIREKLAAHANLLDHQTPGGLGAVWEELRDLKATLEAQAAGVEALVSIAKPTPRRGATAMRKTAGAKDGGDGKAGGQS